MKSDFVRILVIEDEVKLATHLSRALESEGHEARVVHDGKVALVEARDGNYELLVLDVDGRILALGRDLCQRLFVVDAAARGADEDGALLHGGEALRVEGVQGVVVAGAVQRDEVRGAQQRL